jgi:hypothetical protein
MELRRRLGRAAEIEPAKTNLKWEQGARGYLV